MRILAAPMLGMLFGLGILISGMGNPAKVLNFFDVAGSWDPSLAFVMAGGLLVNVLGHQFVMRRSAPMLAQQFELPATSPVTGTLIGGAAVFGIGWGLSGFCPGGLIPVLGLGRSGPLLFLLGLLVGLGAARLRMVRQRFTPSEAES